MNFLFYFLPENERFQRIICVIQCHNNERFHQRNDTRILGLIKPI